MKTYSQLNRKLASSAFLLLVPTASPLAQNQPEPCRQEAAVRALVRAYVLSSVLFESKYIRPSETIHQYLTRENRLFVAGGPSIRCAQVLAERLLRTSVNIYDRDAYGRAVEAGPSEFAADVAKSINANAVMFLGMALELHWLSEVLPSLAQGNATLYNTTGPPTRFEQKEAIKIMDRLLADPENRYLIAHMQSQMQQIEALAERNVFATVVMLR